MGRRILTLLLVVVLSAAIGRVDPARGERDAETDWVRTAQGWQSRSVLATPGPPAAPQLHPSLVAAFQLATSLFFLLAMPTHVSRLQTPHGAVARRSSSARVRCGTAPSGPE